VTGQYVYLDWTYEDGFTLIGLAERVCQGDGYWSGEAPLCHESDSPAAIDYQFESTPRTSTSSSSSSSTTTTTVTAIIRVNLR